MEEKAKQQQIQLQQQVRFLYYLFGTFCSSQAKVQAQMKLEQHVQQQQVCQCCWLYTDDIELSILSWLG